MLEDSSSLSVLGLFGFERCLACHGNTYLCGLGDSLCLPHGNACDLACVCLNFSHSRCGPEKNVSGHSNTLDIPSTPVPQAFLTILDKDSLS